MLVAAGPPFILMPGPCRGAPSRFARDCSPSRHVAHEGESSHPEGRPRHAISAHDAISTRDEVNRRSRERCITSNMGARGHNAPRGGSFRAARLLTRSVEEDTRSPPLAHEEVKPYRPGSR